MKPLIRNVTLLLTTLSALLLGGCNGSNTPANNGLFTVDITAPTEAVTEGDVAGINIPVSITRLNGHEAPLTLSIESGEEFVVANFNDNDLVPGSDATTLNLNVQIADLPIQMHSKTISVVATDGNAIAKSPVMINVEPTAAPDIYLLVGQSNMIGFSGDGTKQAFAGGPDEPNPRIKQLNVSGNDPSNFTDRAAFISESVNAFEPFIVQAEDPLHIPSSGTDNGKDLDYIGLGLSFAKTALANTTADIILVPAAWSATAFCDKEDDPIGHWNAQPNSNPNLGNDWMFLRAVTRANMAIAQTNGVLRGILWHQGESDADVRCADLYAANLESLARELRLNIDADLRGGEARRADSNIPFVVGTMSRGSDERDTSVPDYNAEMQLVDSVHRNISMQLEHSAFSNHDDLVPANGFPCGNTTCIHFGPQALREMGVRYYQALLNAATSDN